MPGSPSATPRSPTVAERCLAAGEQSWNAVKRRWLGEGGEIEAVDLEGLFWIDVDTPADRRRAERTLVSLAARKPLDGPVSRLVNRRLSGPISLVLLRAGVSPGAATVATFLFALAAAAVLALGVVWPAALVLGGILVQLASILDGVDGEIARASLRELAVRGLPRLGARPGGRRRRARRAGDRRRPGRDDLGPPGGRALRLPHDAVREGGLRGGLPPPPAAPDLADSTRGATCASSSPPSRQLRSSPSGASSRSRS